MDFDFDQYYTPIDLAESLLTDHIDDRPKTCVDTTCGAGYLLKAASTVFKKIDCYGMDKDKKAIYALKRERPNWTLSVADLLNPSSYAKSSVLASIAHCDLLFLNPPFSLRKIKNLEVSYFGVELKCSLAMAHILTSIQLLNPKQGAIVIVPESVLYSDTDKAARESIGEKYGITKLADLSSTTFSGTRANASVIRITPDAPAAQPRQRCKFKDSPILSTIIRGSLPVHLMKPAKKGAPFVHSTDLKRIVTSSLDVYIPLTRSTGGSRPEGWTILIPRVGLPKIEQVKAFNLSRTIQLSDCVIALSFSSRANAMCAQNRIHCAWESFLDIYKGTGARYTTIDRLSKWLASKSIIANGF